MERYKVLVVVVVGMVVVVVAVSSLMDELHFSKKHGYQTQYSSGISHCSNHPPVIHTQIRFFPTPARHCEISFLFAVPIESLCARSGLPASLKIASHCISAPPCTPRHTPVALLWSGAGWNNTGLWWWWWRRWC